MPVTHERGYLIPAINSGSVDYVACAGRLADSIRIWHPDAHITIVTADQLPKGNLGGFANDWQCWYISPYRQTIKLEADMIATGPIDHWWTLFALRDVVISQGARDFYDQASACRRYRKIFDDNHLPDVYNAITYWRVSQTAQEFFHWVRNIFHSTISTNIGRSDVSTKHIHKIGDDVLFCHFFVHDLSVEQIYYNRLRGKMCVFEPV